jgi:UDP-glucuronate decarboxylase
MTRPLPSVLDADIAAIVDHDLPWEKLAGRRVTVTGAGGFLGSYVTRVLLELHLAGKVSTPVRVLAMVRDLDRARTRFADLLAHEHFELLHWDLNSIAVPDLRGSHYVIHAASQASPRFYGTDPVGTLLPNTAGTAALLEALRRTPDAEGMLFISSSEVYGAVAGADPLTEADYGRVDPASVRACYAESKRMGETMCVAWHHQHGLPTYIVRPFHTYGPGLRPEDGRVFADFVFNVIRGEDIVINSDGTARRAFCYASDAVRGFFTVLLQGEPAMPYNVANPEGELSVMDLAQLLVGLAPEKKLKIERKEAPPGQPYLASTYNRLVPDTSRLAALGWRPAISPAEGFKRMIEAYPT